MFGFGGSTAKGEGQSINAARYERVSQVGSGSYGVVYKAKDLSKPDGSPEQVGRASPFVRPQITPCRFVFTDYRRERN